MTLQVVKITSNQIMFFQPGEWLLRLINLTSRVLWEQKSGETALLNHYLHARSVTHSLNLRSVGRQARGQGARAVPVIVEPADLLAKHGVKAEAP